MIVAAALAYTFHCIRLGRYAKETAATKLNWQLVKQQPRWCGVALVLLLSLVAFAGSDCGDMSGIVSYAFEERVDISNYVSCVSVLLASYVQVM